MGVSTVISTRIWQGQQKNAFLGEEHQLSFEKFPYSGLVKTYSTSAQTPDSASTMTAISTGVKTVSGMLSINLRSHVDLVISKIKSFCLYLTMQNIKTNLLGLFRLHVLPMPHLLLYMQMFPRGTGNLMAKYLRHVKIK